jgi:hypothetical protein
MNDGQDLPEEVRQWLATVQAENAEQNHFIESIGAAEFHWFFVQGLQAIRAGLYLPGVSCLLNGIEASLRVTITQASGRALDIEGPSPYQVLSNNLLLTAQALGMPVHLLAFPSENDFQAKLATTKPDRIDVEIVRNRNNICHGNVFEFIDRELEGTALFTPECLRDLAQTLLNISYAWVDGLGAFRRSLPPDN